MVKTSGELRLRDDICVEAGAISMESVNNGAPVNSQNHRINGDYTKMNYTGGLDSPRQMIDKAAGQQTRMSEYYAQTAWKHALITVGHTNQSLSSDNTYKPSGVNAHRMTPIDPAPFNLQGDRPGFTNWPGFGRAWNGFSETRGEIVDLTRLISFVIYPFPAQGNPYTVLYHNTSGQLLSAVLNTQSKEWGNFQGHLCIQKLTRADGAKAEAYKSYSQNNTDYEEYADTQLEDGTRVHRMQWNGQSLGPDTNGLYNFAPGDRFLLWFDGIR